MESLTALNSAPLLTARSHVCECSLPSPAQLCEIGRFMADLDQATSIDGAIDVLHDAMLGLGFPQLVYGWTGTPRLVDGRWAAVPLSTRSFPTRWDRDWERHSQHDPYFHRSFISHEATDWDDVREDIGSLDTEERDCIDYADQWGLHHGLTIPVRRPGRFAFVTAVGEPTTGAGWINSVVAAKPLLKLIAHYFDNVVANRFVKSRDIKAPLSQRELECLSWSAQGKTVEDIASILDISSETVRIYLKRINQKLDTLNRAHAIARAISLGLIDLV